MNLNIPTVKTSHSLVTLLQTSLAAFLVVRDQWLLTSHSHAYFDFAECVIVIEYCRRP